MRNKIYIPEDDTINYLSTKCCIACTGKSSAKKKITSSICDEKDKIESKRTKLIAINVHHADLG